MTTGAESLLPVVTTALAGAAAFFSSGAYGLVNPRSAMWGPVLWHGDRSSNAVALTFDDGPLPGSTDRILDICGEENVRCAFFVIGRHAERHPHLVQRMHREGHVVANHTYAHSHYELFGRYRSWSRELARADAAIEQIIGERPAMFRPPMGYKHWHLMNAAEDAGHRVVTWSHRAWDGRATPAEVILRRLTHDVRGGDVLTLHDGNDPHLRPQDRSGTCDAVRPLIHAIRRHGLAPARLDELLRIPAYQPRPARPSPRPGEATGC